MQSNLQASERTNGLNIFIECPSNSGLFNGMHLEEDEIDRVPFSELFHVMEVPSTRKNEVKNKRFVGPPFTPFWNFIETLNQLDDYYDY